MKKGWLDNYGKVENANDSNVSFSENFVGLGNNTKGRNYSPAWGGQFQKGGFIPMSPREQITNVVGSQVNPTPTIPYKQTKDPAEFYKSWIQNPEYKKRLLQSGYVDTKQKTNLIKGDIFEGADHAIFNRLKSLDSLQPIEYSTERPSDARPSVYGKSTMVINPHDYADTSEDMVKAHEMAHIGGAAVADGGGGLQMSDFEKDLLTKSLLPNTRPTISGVQGSEENKISYRNLEDWEHLKKPQEIKADLDALRYKMYDTGIYDITKGQKFTESDFEKSKKSFSKDRVFKRLENRIGKDNLINLMNVIAQNNDENLTPIANNGASLPGATGMMYARTAGSAPSEGKYAKKTLPSAQTGQNIDTVSTTDPRYAELYRNRQVGSWSPQYNAYNLPDLPEFTVIGEDERVKEAMSQTNQRFAEGALNTMSAPQYAMMEMLTGKQQAPSDAWGFQNTGGWLDSPTSFGKNLSNFGMDAVLDPMNLVGVGVADDLTEGLIRNAIEESLEQSSKSFREAIRDGVVPIGYGLDRVLDIPENIKRVRKFGMQKKMPSDIKKLIDKHPDLTKRYFETLRTREAPWNTYLGLSKGGDNMQFTGIDPKTGFEKYKLSNVINPLNPEEARYLSRDLTNSLRDLDRSTIVAQDKTFDVMGGHSQFLSPDKKSIMYRDIWDLQPLKSKLKGKGKIAEKIGEFEVSSLIPGAKPFVSEGKLADIKTKYYPAEPYRNINEKLGDIIANIDNYYDPEYLIDMKDPDKPTPEEIRKYYKEIRNIAKKDLRKEIKEGKTFLNDSQYNNKGKRYADISPYLKVQSKNKFKKKYGGIIEDDNGYLNPDNWGKIVEINSNNITMEGVNEHLLGVSNTGDTKIMEPGKNYKFKGKKVREYPLAKLGINQLDAQPMKKLNQLTNFTNNPDKTNWLDKYN